MEEPPRKRQKLSPLLLNNDNKNDENEDQDENEDDENNEQYFYSLHLNKNMIIFSTDPNVPCNTNFDIESNSAPNLFIVKQTRKDLNCYNSFSWLNYHLNERNDIKKAASLLGNKNISLLIVTGAGMGCDSNLPDYRSKGGFWNDYKIFKDKGLSLYDMSQTKWFIDDPLQAWGFYTHRAKLYSNAIPHSGFDVLLNNITTNNKTDREYMYMTSNIDGQAIKAGFNINNIYQTHGSLHYLQCINNCKNSIIQTFHNQYQKLNININNYKIQSLDEIPKCKFCKGLKRPNVSFFTDDQRSFDDQRIIKQKNRFIKWLNPFITTNKQLLVIEIGCGKSIHSLRWEAQYLKTLKNITLIRINPTEDIDTTNNDRHITLKLPAKLALDSIQSCLNNLQSE